MTKIGLPRALLYYRYGKIWQTFFAALGCETVVSPPTDRAIMGSGGELSVDECCLPAKLFMGHVAALQGRCDAVLVPRVVNYGPRSAVCVKFNALYDIVRTAMPDLRLLCYNIEHTRGDKAEQGLCAVGRELGFSANVVKKAWKTALQINDVAYIKKQSPQVIIISHPYIIKDSFLGGPILKILKELGITYVTSDDYPRAARNAHGAQMSPDLYWLYSRECIGAIPLARDVKGIIVLSAFPCGPDALVFELLMRQRPGGLPMIQIVLDEHDSETGLRTRLESFCDIMVSRK
ncbi:MAG: acyl-CoA dehydratase activase-related protein [Clostridia bacterium]|nr:acyl-CoA dehydratase activase-related protein [Clostridia bacterium]